MRVVHHTPVSCGKTVATTKTPSQFGPFTIPMTTASGKTLAYRAGATSCLDVAEQIPNGWYRACFTTHFFLNPGSNRLAPASS